MARAGTRAKRSSDKTMADQRNKLHPYVSLLLLKGRSHVAPAALLDEVADVLGIAGKPPRKLIERGEPRIANAARNLTVGYIHYQEERQAAWTDAEATDLLNELLLIAVVGDLVAILLTDTSRLGAVMDATSNPRRAALSQLNPVPTGTLNAAFAKDALARTLWLSGIHSRTTIKADSKTLIGGDLRDALDPIGDQTYYFTAMRGSKKLDKSAPATTIGLSPGRSRVWTGRVRSWNEFVDAIGTLLAALAATKASVSDPLPVLAVPVDSAVKPSGAFDLAILPPEIIPDQGANAEEYAVVEKWSYNAGFEVIAAKDAALTAIVRIGAEEIGRVEISDVQAGRGKFVWQVNATPAAGQDDAMAELTPLLRGDRLKVRYDSGHVLAGRRIYEQRFRDMPFEDWRWPDLSGWEVDKEKPTKLGGKGRPVFDPDAVGVQHSLFCWIWKDWPLWNDWSDTAAVAAPRGWLLCDDGALEKADFIHFDVHGKKPLLTLIHVKGSHSKDDAREISVSDYEVVTSQAVKNLRHLDGALLREGLDASVRQHTKGIVWHNGTKVDRAQMIAALKPITAGYDRRVVIVQPRATRRALDKAHDEQANRVKTQRVAIVRQLDTLLLGVRADCRSLGAELYVVGDGSPAQGMAAKAPVPPKSVRKRAR